MAPKNIKEDKKDIKTLVCSETINGFVEICKCNISIPKQPKFSIKSRLFSWIF